MLDTLLTGTFDDLQDKFKECRDISKRPQHHPDLTKQPQYKRIKLPQPSSSSVLCKSRGRWTSRPKLSNQKKSIDDNQSLDLVFRWKVNLEKCIDSSPLLICKGNFALFIIFHQKQHLDGDKTIVSCSHSGIVIALKP